MKALAALGMLSEEATARGDLRAVERLALVLDYVVDTGQRLVADQRRRASDAERQRRKLEGAGALTPSLRALILERDGFRCLRCGADPRDDRLVVDHIVPVARGGESVIENLQTLCSTCNSGKGDRDPHGHDLNSWDR